MTDKDLYNKILGINTPWEIENVDLNIDENRVVISLKKMHKIDLSCPHCNSYYPIYDHVVRSWRHLDTCQLDTIVKGFIPRIKCKEHGVTQVSVPWAEANTSFTALFERIIIDWLKVADKKSVAKILRISWDQADGVQKRAVARGLLRRKDKKISHLGIDETAFKKRHDYVTVIMDKDRGVVLDVLEDRQGKTVRDFFKDWSEERKSALLAFSMDMWPAYIGAVKDTFDQADEKICFDKFHVSQKLGEAVNKTRNTEMKILSDDCLELFKGTKFDWLTNSDKFDNRSRREFMELTRMALKTSRAWSMKETANKIWKFKSMNKIKKSWKKLIRWMKLSNISPMIKVAKTIENHLWGILNASKHGVSNAALESMNTKIQKIKKRACGYRNKKRFSDAILFNFGGLDLYPAGAR